MKEMTQSVIRTLIQVIGIIVMAANAPFFTDLLNALEFVNIQFDSVWSAAQLLIGFATTLYGFFFDPVRATVSTLFVSHRRFKDREIGLRTKRFICDCEKSNGCAA